MGKNFRSEAQEKLKPVSKFLVNEAYVTQIKCYHDTVIFSSIAATYSLKLRMSNVFVVYFAFQIIVCFINVQVPFANA